jgi:hypothetical protein
MPSLELLPFPEPRTIELSAGNEDDPIERLLDGAREKLADVYRSDRCDAHMHDLIEEAFMSLARVSWMLDSSSMSFKRDPLMFRKGRPYRWEDEWQAWINTLQS